MTSVLSLLEEAEIGYKVELELNKFQHKMIIFGGMLNMLAGLIIVLTFYHKVMLVTLLNWYMFLTIANLFNWGFVYKNRHVTPNQVVLWEYAKRNYHLAMVMLCLTWGCIALLYTNGDPHYELYIITILQLCLVGISFGTVTDYVACVIANICLVLPYLSIHLSAGIYSLWTTGKDSQLDISYSLSFLILLTFFLIAIHIGYRLVTRFFKLSFENLILNQKLENVNKFLEQRVKERTLELENSLKLVTFQATHDLLTNLPNQRLLIKYINNAIKSSEQSDKLFLVVFFHLNEIDKINDGLGHSIGDLVIKTIAKRFQDKLNTLTNENITYTVTLSRKDVFVVLIDPILSEEAVEQYVKPLFSILEEPINTEKQLIKLTASLGISIYPRDGKKVNTLLMNADAAMWHARQHGGNHFNIYKNEINADTSKQLELASSLHSALLNTEFMLHYQPFVSLQTGEVCGAEALVRWQHPVFGMVAPDKFIPLAEANGIIVPLGEWVLRTACHQLKTWHTWGFNTLKIAVNLSARQLFQKNLIQNIADILNESGLSPEFLELELTETEAFKQDIIPILKQLKTLGISLSIDDFGTGYSGLSNLRLIAIDKLKIDKSFVQDVTSNEQSKIIIANTINMAKKLNITVIAEGIETLEQAIFLKEYQCDMIQGYYFSRPISADAFGELLKNRTRLQLTSSS